MVLSLQIEVTDLPTLINRNIGWFDTNLKVTVNKKFDRTRNMNNEIPHMLIMFRYCTMVNITEFLPRIKIKLVKDFSLDF